MKLLDEEWRAIPSWEGFYEASTLARIRSLDREVPFKTRHGTLATKKVAGRVLKQVVDNDRYLVVDLCRNNHAEKWAVHVLLLTTFVGPRPAGMYGCHYNDVKTDNRLENLRWATPDENGVDKSRNGCAGHRGERTTFAKLMASDVVAIRIAADAGVSGVILARQYGVNPTSISKILLNKTWRHVAV